MSSKSECIHDWRVYCLSEIPASEVRCNNCNILYVSALHDVPRPPTKENNRTAAEPHHDELVSECECGICFDKV